MSDPANSPPTNLDIQTAYGTIHIEVNENLPEGAIVFKDNSTGDIDRNRYWTWPQSTKWLWMPHGLLWRSLWAFKGRFGHFPKEVRFHSVHLTLINIAEVGYGRHPVLVLDDRVPENEFWLLKVEHEDTWHDPAGS